MKFIFRNLFLEIYFHFKIILFTFNFHILRFLNSIFFLKEKVFLLL
jgi:hypothetical protein